MSVEGGDNYALVEGDWGEFVFRKVQVADWPRVVRHIQEHFCHDEPTCNLLGYSDEFGEEFEALTKQMLGDNLSFLVEHKVTKELAAVRVTFINSLETSFDHIAVHSYAGRVIFRLVDIMKKMANLHDSQGVPKFAEFFVASCTPKYRQHGITTEMYRRNLHFLRAEGYKFVKGIFTSEWTRAAVRKLGFEEICRLDYHEFVDEMGQLVFNPDELTEEHYAAVMIKML